MSRFEYADRIGNIRTGRNTDAAHLRGERVGDVVTVQVQRCDHVILGRSRQDLLQKVIGNDVFHRYRVSGLRVFEFAPGTGANLLGPVQFFREFVAPVAESPLGEFHDIALVHQGHGLAIVIDRVLQGFAYETASAFR